jgi:hypothetical protein
LEVSIIAAWQGREPSIELADSRHSDFGVEGLMHNTLDFSQAQILGWAWLHVQAA